MTKYRKQGRISKAMVAMSLLCTGIVSNHLSCHTLVQDAVADGVSLFISDGTFDLLTTLIRPDQVDGGASNGGNGGSGDPFEPPPAQT